MKSILPILLFFLLMSCNNGTKNSHPATSETEEYKLSDIPTGTVIAADSMRIPDPLNELYFSVKVLTNEQSQNGIFDVETRYGYNNAATQITMPNGGNKEIRPVMKKAAEPFTYIIGFTYGEDTSFYDYFVVSANRGQTKMNYIKAYSFQ